MAESFQYRRLSRDDAACLLVDHQSGHVSLVQDYSPSEFKNNVLALASPRQAISSCRPSSPPASRTVRTGRWCPEIKELFPDAPYIPPGRARSKYLGQ
ncbi:MAG: hypothetical protein U1E17_04315 [Geminicoccaceae bacterium]